MATLFIAVLIFSLWSCRENRKYRILNNPYKIIDKSGKERNYRIFVPAGDQKVPLIVYFHGVMSEKFKKMSVLKNYTGSPVEETGLIEFCKKNSIALLVPEPAYKFKFLNVAARGWSPFKKETDGIEKMIDVVSEKLDILNGKIYLTGISAGAVFVNYLANRRPKLYESIISHSQGYIDEKNSLLNPQRRGKKFGVVLAYTRGDYKNLKDITEKTYINYKNAGYKVVILRDLPPKNHSWATSFNKKFWKLLLKTGNKSND